VIEITGVTGIGEVTPGDDLSAMLAEAIGSGLQDDDVIVVTQKVVSKAEGRLGDEADRQALVRSESRRIVRRLGQMLISETHHGFVCANAGVDASNVPDGLVALLPVDPDVSARRIRSRLKHLLGVDVGVVISDTFGRAWRVGQTDVAIGVAGFLPFSDHVGQPDDQGRIMTATRICIADQIAGAAEMAMGKTGGTCAAIVRGAPIERGRGAATQIVRAPKGDLFR
jgi:coenzyme F420-0:L-glutamate ligase/coenzyme F420-1:gamma-L-glutamate ligase